MRLWTPSAFACAIAFAAGACTTTSTTTQQMIDQLELVSVTSSDQTAIKRSIRSNLKDPDSARFGMMYATVNPREPNFKSVCAFVNARNSFGGYTGEQAVAGRLQNGVFTIWHWNDRNAALNCGVILDVVLKKVRAS